jgi:hypothetical protein
MYRIGELLKHVLISTFEEWNIMDKVECMTTDNGMLLP